MAAIKEMPRTMELTSMSLEEMREHLGRSRQGGRIDPAEKARFQEKMKEIMGRIAKLGRKGGAFGQVRFSEEAMEVYERSRWA